jgi:hypothetical protein
MKKAGKGCLIIFVVILVLGIIGAIAGGGKRTGSSNSSSSNSQGSPTSTPIAQATKIDTSDLVAAYDKNKLAATDQYKGKFVEFSAKIKNISQDITGTPYLSLEPANSDQYYFGTTLQCYFQSADPLKSLANNTVVTLRGTIDDMSLGIIGIKDCLVIK